MDPSEPSSVRGDSALRRSVDIVVSSVALIALLPIFLLTFAAIRGESHGPALFWQQRIGRGRRPFWMVKFRSMVAARPGGASTISGKRDARITRVGAVIRATKIDELPQLWNVLKGDLTLIGPRAEVPHLVRYFTDAELRTLDVRPGLASRGALYFTTHQSAVLDDHADPERYYIEHQLHPKLALELEYLRRRRLVDDLGIVLDTVRVMLTGLVGRA
jgi:lipopolysaccharide/colanic/teichoic acid biosynthesis glycosyltransferase